MHTYCQNGCFDNTMIVIKKINRKLGVLYTNIIYLIIWVFTLEAREPHMKHRNRDFDDSVISLREFSKKLVDNFYGYEC